MNTPAPIPALPHRGLLRTVVLITSLLFLIDLGIDVHYTLKYGGIDLRDKVMGGRLLFTDHSIYTYKWQAGDPEQWLDPNDDPTAALNRYTGSPAQSLLFASIAWLPFGTIKVLWTLLHYLLFTLTVLMLTRGAAGADRVVLWASAVLLVLSSVHWHLHVERAQAYVLFAFLMALILHFASRDDRRAQLTIGVLLALLTVMKPTYALLGIPFLLARRWPVVVAGASAGVICLALFATLGMTDDWRNYFTAMDRWTTTSFDTGGAPDGIVPAGQPAVIEGLGNLRDRKDFEVEDSSLQSMIAGFTGTMLSPRACEILMLGGVTVIMALFMGRFKRMSATDLFLLAFVAWSWAIICMPAPRFNYQLIQWLAPLLVVLRDRRHYAPEGIVLMLAGSLFGLRIFAFAVPYSYFLGEGLMLLGSLLILWMRYRPRRAALATA